MSKKCILFQRFTVKTLFMGIIALEAYFLDSRFIPFEPLQVDDAHSLQLPHEGLQDLRTSNAPTDLEYTNVIQVSAFDPIEMNPTLIDKRRIIKFTERGCGPLLFMPRHCSLIV